MPASDYAHLDVEEIAAETDKAFRLRFEDGDERWVPKSLIADADSYDKGDRNCTVSVALWWAEKEGLA